MWSLRNLIFSDKIEKTIFMLHNESAVHHSKGIQKKKNNDNDNQ